MFLLLPENAYYYSIAGIAPAVPKIPEPFCGCVLLVVEMDKSS
jgi:hypothetical protein